MACPLTLLRQYNVNKMDIVERGDQVVFGEFSWPKSVKTTYTMYGSGKNGSEKTYYTLGCVLYLLKNSRLQHGTYVRQAMTDDVPIVRRPDRKDLLSYLNGITATSLAIDNFAPLEPPTKVKRSADNSLDTAATKKPRLVIMNDKRVAGDSLESDPAKKPCLDRAQKAKEQLAAKLDSQGEVTMWLGNIKSLSEMMSVEKIAAIKAKRLAKKRTTIKEHDDDDIDVVKDVQDSNDTEAILSRERVIRTRANILQSSGKEFQTNVFQILRSIAIKERANKKNMVATPTVSPPKPQAQLSGYNRYDQQRFVQQKAAAEGFVIDTTSTYHGMSLQSVRDGSSAKSSLPNKPVIQPIKKRSSKTPIIVVPSSEKSLITTWNARDILQDLKFKTSNEVKAKCAKRESEVLLQRLKDGNLTVPYLVIDNPLKLLKDDWDRVVAVFVMGPQWQFKGWSFSGNPVEIFSRIPAFHLKYDDMPIDANVAKWAVRVIQLNKTRRHLDRAALMKFWEAIDKFMVTNKPHLRF